MGDTHRNFTFCCTCLKIAVAGDNFVDLLGTTPGDISFEQKLSHCIPEMDVNSEEDNFLCKPCLAALETSYIFRCMCLQTEKRLEEFRTSLGNKTKRQMIESSFIIQELPAHSTSVRSVFSPVVDRPRRFQGGQSVSTQSFPSKARDDSRIELVKDQLGELLTECLGDEEDMDFNDFDATDEPGSIEINIVNSLNAELKDLEQCSLKKFTILREHNKKKALQNETNRLSGDAKLSATGTELSATPSATGPKLSATVTRRSATETRRSVTETRRSVTETRRSVTETKLSATKTRLSDLDIIKKCCKTIPELRNCVPESLNCQIVLRKTGVHVETAVKKVPMPFLCCPQCGRIFARRDRYQDHILRHSNIRAHKCNGCGEGFFSVDTLRRHNKVCKIDQAAASKQNVTSVINKKKAGRKAIVPKKSVLPKKPPMIKKEEAKPEPKAETKPEPESPVVPERLRSTGRKRSFKMFFDQGRDDYRCDHCKFTTLHKAVLIRHQLRHSTVRSRSFICPKCSSAFYESYDLKRHLSNTRCAKDSLDTKTSPNKKSTGKNIKIENPALEGKQSGVGMTTVLNTEVTVTPVIQSTYSLASTSSATLINSQYVCIVCNEKFTKAPDYLQHMQKHESKKAEDSLSNNLPKKKRKTKYFCDICDLSFSSKDHVNIHTKEKPYACPICDRRFGASKTLWKHKTSHKVANDIDAKNKSNIKDKKETVVKPVGQLESKPVPDVAPVDNTYICEICKMTFIGRASLIDHMRQHIIPNSIKKMAV